MNSPQNKEGKEKKIYTSISSLKNSQKKDKYKDLSSNKKSITLNNEENIRNSSELIKPSINQQKINKPLQKNYIFKKKEEMEKEEKVKEENEEEEEEINSDEYVSSTNLDVETNTYINYINKNNEEINLNKNNTNKIIHYPGRLKNKILSDDFNNKIEVIPNKDNNKNNNIFLTDNKGIINNDKNLIILNNINNINENNVINNIKINNKRDFFNINNRNMSNNKENKNNSNSIDYKYVFTPNNEGKKKIKVLREIIFKKLEENLQKNNNIRNNQQSQTINIIENKNVNNLKLINNQIIKNYIKLNFDVNQKKSVIKTVNNESITNNNSFETKNISIKEINQIIPTNNKVDISLYKKNIIKNIGAISINDQKYHLMPKSIKKAKTQGRVGKIIYNKKNKGNNFLYINNNQNTINKTINTRYSLNHNKKINRISPLNNMNNSQNFKSICISKENNFHSLKNLKIDNVQKSLKKYLLEDEYIKMIPMNKENNNNSLEKEQLKTMKDSRNKKFIKNHFKNPFNGANTNLRNINQNIYRIKKTIPLNISQKSQLRSFNSCFPYKINKNALNNFTNEQILTTINNNHENKKIDMLNNFKKNLNLTKKKIRNISDKKYNNEKSINKKDEISYNILPEQCKKNILSFKKIKNLKNKIFSTDFSNAESQNNNKKNNINKTKKNKPLTTRIKIDLVNEENKYNKKINTRNNIINSNNVETLNTIWNNNNNNSISNKIYYEKKSTLKDINFKTLPFKCLSPKLNHIKQIMEKKHPSKIKEMYNKINHNNKGRNSYNIYLSSSMVENNNKHSINNSNIFPHSTNHSNNIIFLKNNCNEDLKERYSNNIPNTDKYRIGNLSKFPTKTKKIYVFNNVNNYNINNTNNTLNNITNIKNNNQNISHICLKRSEELNNFSSLINKTYNRNPKKIYINKSSISHKNSKMIIKNQNSDILEQNIIYIDNSSNKSKNINSNKENKYQYNKNMIYKLNKYNNLVNKYNSPDHMTNSNIYINNKLNNFSMSNNKERNTININDKSYPNLYSIKESKIGNNRNKNNTIDIEKNKKEIGPIQE